MPNCPILVIPDVHQDYAFYVRCMALISGRDIGEVILLGDLLDAKTASGKLISSVRSLLHSVDRLFHRSQIPVTLLWGNHDWKYWGFRRKIEEIGKKAESHFKFFANYDLSIQTTGVLTEEIDDTGRCPFDLWSRAELVTGRYGWLISHAGVHSSLWPAGADLEDGVGRLNAEMKRLAMDPFSDWKNPLLGAGPARGGSDAVGGPLWQDFLQEFTDDLPFPQIVGHTRTPEVLREGRSYCLDACQQVCGILHPDSTLEVVEVGI